jgi:uncharacterized protein YjbI with pentapeptide repeats
MRKISEIFINGACLTEILEKHRKWLNGEDDGERANLRGGYLNYTDLGHTNLRGADLSCASLYNANLRGTDLEGADLNDVDLSHANLRGANLSHANLNYADLRDSYLSYADLKGADLSCADLSGSNLKGTDLKGANLSCTSLREADLRDASLSCANLNKVSYSCRTSFFALVCPEEGSFIGYKKADDKIVKLLITEDSKRSSATTRKCRCSKVEVLNITNIENTEEYNEVASDYDNNFIYRVGETVEVKDYDDNRWNECSTGIHFFITRDEAVIY